MPRDIDLIKISQDTDYRESLEVGQTSYPRLRILSPLPPYSSLPRDLNFIVESSKLSAEQDMSSFNEIEITLFYKKTTTRKNLDKKKKIIIFQIKMKLERKKDRTILSKKNIKGELE